MILDSLENGKLYTKLNPKFKKAFEFLEKADSNSFIDGKCEIDGEDIFALLNEYNTKDSEDSLLEAHKKYIDIQCVLEGEELIGYSPLMNQKVVKKYCNSSDIMFFVDRPSSYHKLSAKMFAIFFPTDLHMPSIKVNNPSYVKKIVVKIKA